MEVVYDGLDLAQPRKQPYLEAPLEVTCTKAVCPGIVWVRRSLLKTNLSRTTTCKTDGRLPLCRGCNSPRRCCPTKIEELVRLAEFTQFQMSLVKIC